MSEPIVWVAVIQVADDGLDPGSEIVGVFTSEREALVAARKVGPRTARAYRFVVDQPAEWARGEETS